MPDINLLKDTKSAEEKNKKRKSSFSFDMTKSNAEKLREEKIKPKSSSYGQAFSEQKETKEGENKINQNVEKKGDLEDIFASDKKNKKEKNTEKVEYTESETDKLKGKEIKPKRSFFTRFFSRQKKEKEPKIISENKSDKDTENIMAAPGAKKKFGTGNVEYSKPSSEAKAEIKEIKKEKKKKEKSEDIASSEDSFLVNLLPEELMGREEPRKKLINLGFISLGAIVLIILAYFSLAFYQSNIVTRTQEVRQERLDLDKQISDLKNQQDASIDYKRKLEAVKNIISHHVYWSKFFEKLEEYTIKDVYYVGAFNGVLNSTINLSAETNNFTSVAEQLIVFQNAEDFVSEVIITGAKKSGSGSSSEIAMPGEIIESFVTFSISLKLVPSIFYELIEEEEVVSADSNVNSNTNTSFSVNTNTNSNTITDNNSNTNTNTDFINNSNTNFNSNINTDFNFNTNSSL